MANLPDDADWPKFRDGDLKGSLPTFTSGLIVKFAAILGTLLFIAVVLSVARAIFTDWLWFGTLGYQGVYLKILSTKLPLFVLGTILFAAAAGANLIYADRISRGLYRVPLPLEVIRFIKRMGAWGIWLIIFVLAIIFGSVLAGEWELFLRFINDVPFTRLEVGSQQTVLAQEPAFGNNISFYVFTLPLFSLIQGWLLSMLIAITLMCGLIYFVNFGLRGLGFVSSLKVLWSDSRVLMHFSFLVGLFLLVIGAGYWVDIYELLFSSDGAVFGASFTELNAKLPALRILISLSIISSLVCFANIYFKSANLVLGSVVLWMLASITLVSVYPALVQRFQVKPNELQREGEYIPRTIDFTRQGFALDRITEEGYDLAVIESGDLAGELAPITAETVRANPETIDNIRLWDHRPLRSLYNQIQFFRAYYRIIDVDVDRYKIDGQVRQVILGARELFSEDLPIESQSWINRHLQFTHGFGIAMSPATEFTPEGKPDFFIKDIPPRPGKESLIGEVPEISRPQIYYGENSPNYVIVNSDEEEFDFPDTEGLETNRGSYRYVGSGGVALDSFVRKVAYALEFSDIEILISDAITAESSIQYRRQVQDRVIEIAPFLRLDSDPYMVVADGRLWWMQDAYTTTNYYPYSDPSFHPSIGRFNYIRNSVKVVVDAYNGSVDFYIFDEEDAIITAYAKMFPDLFKSKSEMPVSLQEHIRYPSDFFSIQAEKYLLYHMEDTRDFYRKEDPWSVPREMFFDSELDMEPYYVIMKLPGEAEEEFVLLLPFTPLDKPNQIAWLAARSDNDRGQYGTLKAFLFPKGTQVDGPEQVEARIDNDFTIKKEFTLLCQRGARCIRGNLLVIPIVHEDKKFLMYVEPLYIQAENVAFPELKQVIVADAKRVVMKADFKEAMNALVGIVDDTADVSDDMLGVDGIPSGHINQSENIQQALEGLKQSVEKLEQELEDLLKIHEESKI